MQINYCTDFMSAPFMMSCGATHIVFTIFAMLAYIRDFSAKQSGVLLNANYFLDQVVHVHMKLENNAN